MIDVLKLHHVRGLEEATLHLGPSVNLWIGENGAGKTSVLEAVALLSYGRSFVTARNKSLISFDQADLTVFAGVRQSGQLHRMAIQVTRSGERRLRFDGAAARGQATLSRALPVLTIAPHIADLISASPGDRRRFIDWGAFHCAKGEASVFAGLRRALLQRNTGLRSGTISDAHLDAWDQQIVMLGKQVDAWRERFVAQIGPVFSEVVGALGLESQVGLKYLRGWGDRPLEDELMASRSRDRRTRLTQVGPHRADLEFTIGSQRAAEVLSRGQLKAAHVALILAQLQVSRETGGEPVLCLDDPGAELDSRFQKAVWAQILKTGCQVLVTGIDVERVGLAADQVSGAKVFHVKQGTIQSLKEG